jgi:hypothetical protein
VIAAARPGIRHNAHRAGSLPIVDTFNRANSSITLNPASDAGIWTVYGGTFGIVGNQAYAVSPSSLADGALRDSGYVACDITLTYNTTSYCRGNILFAFDPATGDTYSYQPWRTTLSVQRWIGGGLGVNTDLGVGNTGGTQPPPGTVIRVTYDGVNTIRIYWNDVLKETIVDTSPLTAGTWVGFGSTQANSSTGETWENFNAIVPYAHFFSDDFNRVNSSTSIGGTGWTVHADGNAGVSGGAWGISSNQAYTASGPSGGAKMLAYRTLSTPDVDMTATWATVPSTDGPGGGLLVRVNSALTDFYWASLQNLWHEAVGGSQVQVANYGLTVASGDVLRVVSSGHYVDVYVNGVLVVHYDTGSDGTGATRHGLVAYAPAFSTGSRWDDFSVAY